jgi:hypothetical protein
MGESGTLLVRSRRGNPDEMEAAPPCCVGLVGDGDDIAAIGDVEEAFRVTLDDQDVPGWLTAGDVFESLLKTLPPDAATDPSVWERFATALALETGINPDRIEKNSPLLLPGKGTWGEVKDALVLVAFMWLTMLLVLAAI